MLHYHSPYWLRRQGYGYYRVVRRWVEEYGRGDLILDVGAMSTPVVGWGDFAARIAIDRLVQLPTVPGVTYLTADWLTYRPPRADLVTCLQVLEHIGDDDILPFARKLVSSCRRLIVSVPFMWPVGRCRWHRQDPVSLEDLVAWTGLVPIRSIVVADESRRLVAEFRGELRG